MEFKIIVALLAFILFREVWFTVVTHRMINKLMSRDYRDFKLAEQTGTIRNEVSKPKYDDPQDAEDLGALSGII